MIHHQPGGLIVARTHDLAGQHRGTGAEGDRIRGRIGGIVGQLYPARTLAERAAAETRRAMLRDGAGVGRADLAGRLVEPGDDERNLHPQAFDRAQIGARIAILAIRVDHQPRQVGRQENQVVEGRLVLLAERVVAVLQPSLQNTRLDLDLLRRYSRHREDRFAAADRVVGRAGLGVAAKTARGLEFGFGLCVGGLDLGKLDRHLAEAVELLLDARVKFPGRVVANRHATGAVWRAIGQRIVVALQKSLDVIGGTMALVHGFDDGRTAKGAVAGGEYLVIVGAHTVETRAHAVPVHQPELVELAALGFLPDRGNHQAAVDVVLRALDIDRPAAAVLVGLAEFGAHAAQSAFDDRDRLPVIDNLDALFHGAVQFLAPRRHRLVVAAVNDLDVVHARQPLGHATGVHRNIAAADHQHGLRQRRSRAAVDLVEKADAVTHEGFGFAGNPHRLADEGADREQHGIVPLLELVERNVAAECTVQVNLDTGAMRHHAIDVLL